MSVADAVRDWVAERPYVQEALVREIVNYAALARQVQDDVDGGFEAVKMALRREQERLAETRRGRQQRVTRVLDGTSVELKSGVQVCKTDLPQEGIVSARTAHGHTTVQPADADCPGATIADQVLLTLDSPQSLEETPGVLAYLLDVLAGHGINVTECISCREDTHLVLDAADATTAFSVLDAHLA